MDASVADTGVTSIRAAVDELLATDFAAIPARELAEMLSGLEVQRRRLDAVDARLIAGLAGQATPAQFGATSVPDLIGGLTRVTRAQGRVRAQRAMDVVERRTLTGEALAPIHPRVAAALAAGEISGAHVDVITHYLGRIPPAVAMNTVDSPDGPGTVFEAGEAFLVDAARHEDPATLRRSGELLLARVDPDGPQPRDQEQQRRRGFGIGGRGGPNAVHGELTGETKAVWEAILDSLAAPRPGPDGQRDPRSAWQRNHDGLLEAGLRLLRSGTLPATGGVPVSIIVRLDAADMDKAARGEPGPLVHSAHGDLLDAHHFLRLAGDAQLTTVALTATGGILNYGRTRRLASPDQRRALTARDGGCCFPHCTRPAAWTEVHHIRAWIHGGRTDLNNLCLLCNHHHRNFEGAGWTVEMINDIPHWTPPAWLDPTRQRKRNTAHHLPEITFSR